jgi:hypothetical protein
MLILGKFRINFHEIQVFQLSSESTINELAAETREKFAHPGPDSRFSTCRYGSGTFFLPASSYLPQFSLICIILNIFSFRVAILGYLRPEQNFESLEDLVRAIENDIKQSRDKLNDASVEKWRHDTFFSQE